MLVSDLVLDSYYLAGILDPSEQVDGYYLQVGVRVLNRMIADWSSASQFITFYSTLTFPLTGGKAQYEVSKFTGADVNSEPITDLVEARVEIDNIKYPLKWINTKIDNINMYDIVFGIPWEIYVLQEEGKTYLRFYATPSQDMTAVILAKTRLAQLSPFETTTSIADRATMAVSYQLALYLANWFQLPVTDDFKASYTDVVNRFKMANIQDLAVEGDRIGYGNVTGNYPLFWGF